MGGAAMKLYHGFHCLKSLRRKALGRLIDTIRLYMYGDMEKSTALKRLSEHQPNHQICFLNQEAADKYLTFIESIEL